MDGAAELSRCTSSAAAQINQSVTWRQSFESAVTAGCRVGGGGNIGHSFIGQPTRRVGQLGPYDALAVHVLQVLSRGFSFFGRMVALVRIRGTTRQRGLELRLRDLGQIWVSGFGPSEPAAANAAPYASSGQHPLLFVRGIGC